MMESEIRGYGPQYRHWLWFRLLRGTAPAATKGGAVAGSCVAALRIRQPFGHGKNPTGPPMHN
jgi:hypothetical protein